MLAQILLSENKQINTSSTKQPKQELFNSDNSQITNTQHQKSDKSLDKFQQFYFFLSCSITLSIKSPT
jgi:hypothetical protein